MATKKGGNGLIVLGLAAGAFLLLNKKSTTAAPLKETLLPNIKPLKEQKEETASEETQKPGEDQENNDDTSTENGGGGSGSFQSASHYTNPASVTPVTVQNPVPITTPAQTANDASVTKNETVTTVQTVPSTETPKPSIFTPIGPIAPPVESFVITKQSSTIKKVADSVPAKVITAPAKLAAKIIKKVATPATAKKVVKSVPVKIVTAPAKLAANIIKKVATPKTVKKVAKSVPVKIVTAPAKTVVKVAKKAGKAIKKLFHLGGISGFFQLNSITSLDDLKKQYYTLAKIYHPDRGGTNEQMKDLNNEYELLFKAIQNGQSFTKEEKDIEYGISEVFKEIINQIIKFPNINIEIVGNWIWVSGATYPIREDLKKSGFMFASVKKMWFWRPEEYKSKSKGDLTMDEIRNKYGSMRVNTDTNKYLSGPLNLSKSLKRLQKLIKKRAHLEGIGGFKGANNVDPDNCIY